MENYKVLTVDEKEAVQEAQAAASAMEPLVREHFKGMDDTALMLKMKRGEL
jgi:hypothetical protein